MPVLPDSRPYRYATDADPALAEKALRDVGPLARRVWLYAAVHPVGTLLSRADLADDLGECPLGRFEEALRELVEGGWMVAEPPGCPGCGPDGRFRLAVDAEPEPEPEPEAVVLAPGVIWVPARQGVLPGGGFCSGWGTSAPLGYESGH